MPPVVSPPSANFVNIQVSLVTNWQMLAPSRLGRPLCCSSTLSPTWAINIWHLGLHGFVRFTTPRMIQMICSHCRSNRPFTSTLGTFFCAPLICSCVSGSSVGWMSGAGLGFTPFYPVSYATPTRIPSLFVSDASIRYTPV